MYDDSNIPKMNCPKVDCKKKGKCCITTRKVVIPAVLGDDSPDSEVAPVNGLYCDAIVEYEANGHVYIYSSDGIPTQIKSDSTDDIKLYDTTGTHTDGAMTQKATTEALNEKQDELIAGPGISIVDDPYTRKALIMAQSAEVDSALSYISTNPVQNKVITAALDGKANSSEIANLATKAELQTKADKTELDNYTTTADLDAQLALKADKTQLGNYATIADMNAGLDAKQDILTAGTGIDITNNVISATAGTTPNLQQVLEAGHIADKFFRITLDNDTNTFSQVGGNQVTTQRTANGVTRSSTITTEGLSLSKVGRGVPTEYFEVSLIGRGGVEDPLVRISDGVKTAFNAALGNVSYTAGTGIDITNGVISSTVDTSTFATKTELTTGLATKADTTALADYYTKTQADALLADKADTADLPDMTDYYNKTQTDALLADKADTSTLADYATTQALTTGLAGKVDTSTLSDYYTKTATDALLADKADTSDIPDVSNLATKTELTTGLAGKVDTATLADYATTQALTTGLATKQNALTAGDGISITSNTISATNRGSVDVVPGDDKVTVNDPDGVNSATLQVGGAGVLMDISGSQVANLASKTYVDNVASGVFVIDTTNPCSYNELQSAINTPKVILIKHEGVIYPFVEKWESDENTKRYVNIASLQRQAVDKGAMYFFFEATIGDFDSPMAYSSNFTQPTGKPYTDNIAGNLTDLTTTAKTNVVSAINELKSSVDALGEPFRVKQWGASNLNVTIVPCTSDAANTSLAKMVFTITGQEATDYQIVGMLAYEVFDAASGGNRINCWPVCQFTGSGQTELNIRWMCGGTTDKVAKRINAWVLLKHR